MAKWILCVILLQHSIMAKNKSFPVPSGGECKQICIENVNKLDLIDPVNKCCHLLGRFYIITITKSGTFERTSQLSCKWKIWTVNSSHINYDGTFKERVLKTKSIINVLSQEMMSQNLNPDFVFVYLVLHWSSFMCSIYFLHVV